MPIVREIIPFSIYSCILYTIHKVGKMENNVKENIVTNRREKWGKSALVSMLQTRSLQTDAIALLGGRVRLVLHFFYQFIDELFLRHQIFIRLAFARNVEFFSVDDNFWRPLPLVVIGTHNKAIRAGRHDCQ